MKKALFSVFGILAFSVWAPANVVRPAPNFSFDGASKSSLKALHGQPVVLIIAKSAKDSAFKSQVKKLKELYQDFAAKEVVFVAAFLEDDSAPISSNIPFVVARNGAQVASAYEVEGKFAIAIIGKDGNIDLLTSKVIAPERVREVLISSFSVQLPSRT